MKKPQRTSSKNSPYADWDAFTQSIIRESVDPDYDGFDELQDEEPESATGEDSYDEPADTETEGSDEESVVIEIPKDEVPTELVKGILQGLGKEAAQALVDEIFAGEEAEGETSEEEAPEESEGESEEDTEGEEPAGEEEGEEGTEDMSSYFMDEDEETIEDGGASQNVKANGSVGAPTRTTHNGAYENGKTTKSVYDKTVSGTGTPANSVGAPSRTTHSGSYENGKTAKSKLTPGKHIFEV